MSNLPAIAEQELLVELANLASICPEGVYVCASISNKAYWHGVIFVRSGPYAGGVFRFEIFFPKTYPHPSVLPRVHFTTPLSSHPFVMENGDLNFAWFWATQCNSFKSFNSINNINKLQKRRAVSSNIISPKLNDNDNDNIINNNNNTNNNTNNTKNTNNDIKTESEKKSVHELAMGAVVSSNRIYIFQLLKYLKASFKSMLINKVKPNLSKDEDFIKKAKHDVEISTSHGILHAHAAFQMIQFFDFHDPIETQSSDGKPQTHSFVPQIIRDLINDAAPG